MFCVLEFGAYVGTGVPCRKMASTPGKRPQRCSRWLNQLPIPTWRLVLLRLPPTSKIRRESFRRPSAREHPTSRPKVEPHPRRAADEVPEVDTRLHGYQPALMWPSAIL